MLRQTATVEQGPGTLRLSVLDGVPLDPPVELVVDEASLDRYVTAAGRDAQEAFGTFTPPDRAALHLLSVDVEETVLTRKPRHRRLTLGPRGLAWEH